MELVMDGAADNIDDTVTEEDLPSDISGTELVKFIEKDLTKFHQKWVSKGDFSKRFVGAAAKEITAMVEKYLKSKNIENTKIGN